MRTLLYTSANREIPRGVISSTARKGDKWFKRVRPGDMVQMQVTETGESLGVAIIVDTQLVTFAYVIAPINAAYNRCGVRDPRNASYHLRMALEVAYGPSANDDLFTLMYLMPLNSRITDRSLIRETVYDAIDSERDYQTIKWGDHPHEIAAFTSYIQEYTNKLVHVTAISNDTRPILDAIRKVGGLAVACMEQHGAPLRKQLQFGA